MTQMEMETPFSESKLAVPSYVMESSSNHPCHRLSIPAARLFWCRHCMQIFEDPITRWRHSKTCLNSSSRNVKKDRDGRTMQVFVNADNLSHCHREENKSKVVSRGVGTGKSPGADLRCRICKKAFMSIEEMRIHVRTPCRKRPSLGVSKHKYTTRHNDSAPIQIPDTTSEIIYIKDGHQTVFSLESKSPQCEGINPENIEPQPSNFKENAFQYGSCGNEELIIPDTFDNTSNLNTIEQTVEITAVEMVPPNISKVDDLIKQCYKCKENKENNIRKRKRVITKEIEERTNHKINVPSSPKGDQQISLAPPLPSVTDTPKDVPEDVESPMVKIAKVMKDLEDLLLKQPTIETVTSGEIDEFHSDNSKSSVTDNLPNDVITELCENAPEEIGGPPDEEIATGAVAEARLKDLFTSVKVKNQVKLSPKNVKTLNLSAVSPHKTSNSNSKCTVRKDLNRSNLSPALQDDLCLDLFMPVNACSVTLPDPLLDIKNGMPAEVLLDETTSTKPPVATAPPETILSSQDSAVMKDENKLPSYIFEGDLLPLQVHSDVLFEEPAIDEKESSEECIIQTVEEVTQEKDCSSSPAGVVAAEIEQPIDNASHDKALTSVVIEPLIEETPASELINFEIPTEELQVIPSMSQETPLDSTSDEINKEKMTEVNEQKVITHQMENQQVDVNVEEPQVEENKAIEYQAEEEEEEEYQEEGYQEKEYQLTEQLEDQVEEDKMEQHQMKEIIDEILGDEESEYQREEESEYQQEEESEYQQDEEPSQSKEKKSFSGKFEGGMKHHKSQKLYKCKACSNTYKTAQALQKHSRVPCKVKHTRSLCQKILRPKRPCAKIEKKPVKKKIVKPTKRPKLMVPIVPITRPEVARPVTPKRPRRFSRRKRRKSSFIDEQKRILPFVNVLMSELSVKDLFFYKLGLINSSCKPTCSSEIMSETPTRCKLGKTKSFIGQTSADLPPFDTKTEMSDSSVESIETVSISDVFKDCPLPEEKAALEIFKCKVPSAVDNNYKTVLESTTSVVNRNCLEVENHQNKGNEKNDTEIAADTSVDLSVPHVYNKANETDSNCQNQSSVLPKETHILLMKASNLSSVTCDHKNSFTIDKDNTSTDNENPKAESPIFHTSDSVYLRKKPQQESDTVSNQAQSCEPPILDSSSDDVKYKTKKLVVSEEEQHPTEKHAQQTTLETVNSSSIDDNIKITCKLQSSDLSVVSSSILPDLPLVSNETVAKSNSSTNQAEENSSMLSSSSLLVSSQRCGTEVSFTTSNNSAFYRCKSDLQSENKSSVLTTEKESSTSLPLSDITDKNARTEGPATCLPNQRCQFPHLPAADSPSHEHLVDKSVNVEHRPLNDASLSLCSAQPLHIEISDSPSKKLDNSHSSKQRHFSDIFGNEKSSLSERDNSNDQHCQISPSKERSKRHFTDFLSSLTENSVNMAQQGEITHLPECSLFKREVSNTCRNALLNQIPKRSDTDPCVSCQPATDAAENINQTCHNARCVPGEAKSLVLGVNESQSHQVSLSKKPTHCNCILDVSSVSIEPPQLPFYQQLLEPSSADVRSNSKSCLHTDNISNSGISPSGPCAQGCSLKIQENTVLHEKTHAAAHVLSLKHRVSDFVSLTTNSVALTTNTCPAALSADSSGEPSICVPSLNSSLNPGGGTEPPLQNSTTQQHQYHHNHHPFVPTTLTSSTSSSLSSSSTYTTSISSTTTNSSTTAPSSTATSSKELNNSNIGLNSESITKTVSDITSTPSLCVATKNSTEQNDCCSTAANALTIVVEDTDSSTTGSNKNQVAVNRSCSESSSSDIQTRCSCSEKLCQSRQKLKGSICLGNNEDKPSMSCNCSSGSNSNNSSNNNKHQHHLHHHHHHNCNNTSSNILNAKGPLIPESLTCLCSKRLETRATVLKEESNVMSCKNPFQSRVIPSSVICVKRALNPRISVATQTDSSFLKEAKVVQAVSSSETRTCDSVEVIDISPSSSPPSSPPSSPSSQTCPKQTPEPTSLEQQLTSEEVVQEEILLDANTLPLVGETLVNTQLPTVVCEEIQYDRKDSPASNSLISASDSTQPVSSGKASNSVNSPPTSTPTSIGATELMAVSSVGSESNVYVQYVGEFDPSLLPEEVTFVIIQSDSGEGLQVADGQSLIIEGSGFEEATDGASTSLHANMPVSYALQQRDDITGDTECIASEI